MDKDTGSIGALRNPPPATKKLYFASVLLDITGLLLLLFIHPIVLLLAIPYIGASKIYSWNKTRIKKYPIAGWLLVISFQGAYTFFLTCVAVSPMHSIDLNEQFQSAMLLSSLLIGAYYPMTQIYQHDEDIKRGDKTISYLLGIRGTFLFALTLFGAAIGVAWYHFDSFFNQTQFWVLIIGLSPVAAYFLIWFKRCWKNPKKADFNHAMAMTVLSSVCLLLAFITLLLMNHPFVLIR